MVQSLLSILFPERCIGCAVPGVALCAGCIRTIPSAKPIDTETIAIYDYGNRIVRDALWELKYHRHARAARLLTRAGVPFFIDCLSDHLQSTTKEPISLIPIPQHRHKRTLRGFNQSAKIARWVRADIAGAEVNHVLEKTRETDAQARMTSRHARLKNVHHSMRSNASLDKNTLYIIVDDVTTTGATFAEARRALKVAGAKKILCVALAHGYASL